MSRLKKALERAKSEYPDIHLHPTVREQDPIELPRPEEKPAEGDEVKISFSTTKVQPVSHDDLRKSKILALFSEYKVSDQIKTLRSQVLTRMEKIGVNTLMVTSANPGEGKSFTSINLGVSIAQELDKTVLIVDADLKNPTKAHCDFATDFFNIDVECGLADVLTGKVKLDDALINPGIEKLTLLPGGTYLQNSSELLGSPQMAALVEDLKSRYKERIVIFDTPAVLACADPVQLSKFIESVLFVVEEERTSADDIRKAVKLLSDIPMIGMILNKSKSN